MSRGRFSQLFFLLKTAKFISKGKGALIRLISDERNSDIIIVWTNKKGSHSQSMAECGVPIPSAYCKSNIFKISLSSLNQQTPHSEPLTNVVSGSFSVRH